MDVASLGRMSPTHARNFGPFWKLIQTLLMTNLEISGLKCNVQGCTGSFGNIAFVKAQLIVQKYTVFFGVLLGSSERLVLSHRPTPHVQSS